MYTIIYKLLITLNANQIYCFLAIKLKIIINFELFSTFLINFSRKSHPKNASEINCYSLGLRYNFSNTKRFFTSQ